MSMHGPRRRESKTSAPECGTNGSPLMRMPLISSWDIHWSWRRANAVNSVRGGARPWGSMRRPSVNSCVFRGRTFPEAWQGDGCGSCTLAWPPWHRSRWHYCSTTSSLVIIILTYPCRSASWSMPSWPRWVFMWPSWSQMPYINL